MTTSIPKFNELAKKLDSHLSNLKTVERQQIRKTLKGLKGVYIFLEDDIPIYVGKTDNLVRRLSEHCRVGSKNNDANFAFKIAKLEWASQNEIPKKITRKFLEELSEFNDLFSKAKYRVSRMKMKYVHIDDPYEQYLFEFYAALHFETKYNDFRNH